jgi:hypothetical protein
VAIGTDRIDADSVALWLAPWLGQAQRSRLKAALVQVDADELTARTRNRATVSR